MALTAEQLDYLAQHREFAVAALLSWFATQARELPWRVNRTPYRVWVSEIMLQQTQVETVIPYYERFMAEFPSVADLADADQERVLKLWEGLGYYSRARSLHKAAGVVMERYQGELPADREQLQELPGIGAYTSGAISSLVYGIPAPAIDGNVRRVLSRLLVLDAASPADLEEVACQWVPQAQPGAFNEALIELGATLCRPRNPKCLLCPWQPICLGAQSGTPEQWPAQKARKRIPHYDVVAAVIMREDGKILVAQRRQEDMLGGMWEFPGGKCEPGESLAQALQREMQEEMAVDITAGEQLTVVQHAYTHFRITLYALLSRILAGELQCIECADFRWVSLDEIADLPMAVTDRKIAQALADYLHHDSA